MADDGGLVPRLLELRVLDGPNRFFRRPAVKVEFVADAPGAAEAVAQRAAEAVRRLHAELDLPRPALAFRNSHDAKRSMIAFPWRRRAIGQAIGEAAAGTALGTLPWSDAVARVRAVAPGPLASVPSPRIPVVAITGTNGKSTTTRLLVHIASQAGMRVGSTTSDGIYLDGQLVESGDYTGFAGASRVLSEPGLDLAVLETARGGILLRGIGYRHNDVSVVTNVSADHLGLHGIDTLDELAEVKGTLVQLTRRDGWAVLNADDDRVWSMRKRTRARIYAFSLDPYSHRCDGAMDAGGRSARARDGWLVLGQAGREPHALVQIAELPVTLAGLSAYNVANALAAAAAADALGIDHDLIARGLRSFTQDSSQNPGRLNLYELDGRIVVIDFAHNESGLAGLLDVCRALAGERRVLLGLGTAGDRADEMLRNLGTLAGERADRVTIAEKLRYLRGRDRDELNQLYREGVARAGRDVGEVDTCPTELSAVERLLGEARPGDVVAVMCHAERVEIFEWLESVGAQRVGVERLAQLVGRRTQASPGADAA